MFYKTLITISKKTREYHSIGIIFWLICSKCRLEKSWFDQNQYDIPNHHQKTSQLIYFSEIFFYWKFHPWSRSGNFIFDWMLGGPGVNFSMKKKYMLIFIIKWHSGRMLDRLIKSLLKLYLKKRIDGGFNNVLKSNTYVVKSKTQLSLFRYITLFASTEPIVKVKWKLVYRFNWRIQSKQTD